MALAALVFVAVTGIALGGYAAVMYVPGLLAQRRFDRRLRDVSTESEPESEASDQTVVKRLVEGPLPAVDRFMARTQAGGWLGRLIEQSGVRTTVSAVMVMSVIIAAACALTAHAFARLPFASLGAAIVGGLLPFAWLRHRRSSRLKKFEEQFPEALDVLSRAVRAGHAFQSALSMAADELPAPVGPELKKTFEQQNYGLPLRDALNQLSERVAILDVRFFVTAVLIQRDTGGNLAEILDNLAHVVRERFKIQRQVRVHTAHGRFTGYVLLALPAFLAFALSFLNGEHMGPLFHEHMGRMMLTGALGLQTVGYFWIRKVIKIEV